MREVIEHPALRCHPQSAAMTTAIRMLARIHSGIAEEPILNVLSRIPSSAPLLRSYLARAHATRHGYAVGTWHNMRSQIMKALRVVGVKVRLGRRRIPLLQPWQRRLDELPKREKGDLYPFARWAVEEGLNPLDVDQGTFDRYEQMLQESDLRRRPVATYRTLCKAWNGAPRYCGDWPAFRVARRPRYDRYQLPKDAFAPTFFREIGGMMQAAMHPDPLQPRRRKRINQKTAAHQTQMLLRLASALVAQTGCDPKTITCVADLLEPGAARAALRFLISRAHKRQRLTNPGGEFEHTQSIHLAAALLCTLARWWVGVPEAHLEALKELRTNTHPEAELCGMTAKNRATLRYFEDPDLVARFLAIPDRVFQRHRRRKDLRRCDALELQSAAAIAMLIAAPVRPKNATATEIDKNLFERGRGTSRRLHLYFPAADVKNSVELEFVLPEYTSGFLDEYLARARPVLAADGSPFLFPGCSSGHKCASGFSVQIADFVEKEIGVRLTAQQFRHLAGFLYLQENPNGYEVVRLLLGHKKIDTTIRFYAGAEARAAHKRYDDFMARRRREIGLESVGHRRGTAHA